MDENFLNTDKSADQRPNNRNLCKVPTEWAALRRCEVLADVTLVSEEGEEYHTNRLILLTSSSYFRALFTTCLNPSTKPLPQRVVLDNVPRQYLELLLDYSYKGTCTVCADTVERLLPIADQYGFLGVVDICCGFLQHHIHVNNCLGIYRFSQAYHCASLHDLSKSFALRNFEKIVSDSSELCDLTTDEFNFFLNHDELNVGKEEVVLEAIGKWWARCPESRQEDVPRLLSCVRLAFVSSKERVRQLPFIENHEQSCQAIDSPNTVRASLLRLPADILFAVGGWNAGCPTNFVETYDYRADRWHLSIYTDQHPRAYHGICTLDDKIYMVGGYDGVRHFNTLTCFDPKTRRWSEKACMHYSRCYVCVATLKGFVYAIGGLDGRDRMKSAEKYDPNSNQWYLIASMKKNRSDASAAALNEKIYVAGGFNGREVLRSAEVYDPALNQWTFITSMGQPRSGVSLVGYDNTIYALGGFDGTIRLRSGEKLDTSNARWQPAWEDIPDMNNCRSNFATIVLDNKIFVIGGFNGATTIPDVEYFDPGTCDWTNAAAMNLSRSALSVAVISNDLNYTYLQPGDSLGWEAISQDYPWMPYGGDEEGAEEVRQNWMHDIPVLDQNVLNMQPRNEWEAEWEPEEWADGDWF